MILLKKLRDENIVEYYYTPFNLFEIIGKLSKIKYDLVEWLLVYPDQTSRKPNKY